MKDLTELNKLEEYLKARGMRYERFDNDDEISVGARDGIIYKFDRHQIIVPASGAEAEWDAICQSGSYGAEEGLLEIYGKIVRPCGDSVEGYLTAEDVIDRIEEVYGKEGTNG